MPPQTAWLPPLEGAASKMRYLNVPERSRSSHPHSGRPTYLTLPRGAAYQRMTAMLESLAAFRPSGAVRQLPRALLTRRRVAQRDDRTLAMHVSGRSGCCGIAVSGSPGFVERGRP